MPYNDVSISFRFFSISPAERDSLRRLCCDIVSRPARGREGRVTGVFDLHEGADYSWLKRFVDENKIAASDYGLFVSISTDNDSEIVRVPQFANDLIREVGGVIDFSFTVLSEE